MDIISLSDIQQRVSEADAVADNADESLGELLAQPSPTLSCKGLTVVDLTGLGIQDLAVASLVI